ncbi:MAG: UpxY family transcription antiterminator [Bacteroidales bacterium]|nr:UpxY family transcription antiterminator [Bacteroidales bacterium]
MAKYWFALYTKSRSEKKVNQEFINKGIECYLPLEKKLKLWSDRKKWVEEPFFRSYIFVKTEEHELQNALNTIGVVSVIKFGGIPAKVQEEHINIIKSILATNEDLELSTENFNPGEKVEVESGSLKGLFGELVHHLNKYKVLVRIESINQNILIKINPSHLKKV